MRAMAEILNDTELERQIESFSLVPSEGGRFEFSVNGELVYSKIKTYRHAEKGELKQLLKQHLAGK
ncbi:MAG: Rdx family protein [Anaerolineales bacterium]